MGRMSLEEKSALFSHADLLQGLNDNKPLLEKVAIVHSSVMARYPFIDRIAVATYDPDSDALHTFAASGDHNPLLRYSSRLADAPSLREVLNARLPRVVNDLAIFSSGEHEHTRKIAAEGMASSYTVPIFQNEEFWGFVFFNSHRRHVFQDQVLDVLDLYAHLLAGMTAHEMSTIRMLLGALKTATTFVHQRDPETHAHLQRMARYARLVAVHLAATGEHPDLTDEMIERIFWFAPMHDIGKLGISDSILRKPSRLTEAEIIEMRRHCEIGAELLGQIIDNFRLHAFHGIDVLREVASMHHETLDGSGYPKGLEGDEVPIAARIIAVADIFDALTSRRPYKRPWTNDEAIEMLELMAKSKLDAVCVEALVQNRDALREIQRSFVDIDG